MAYVDEWTAIFCLSTLISRNVIYYPLKSISMRNVEKHLVG